MSQYRNILLVIDPAMKETTAYHRAVELARRSGAVLHLCLFDYQPAIAASRHIDEAIMRMAADEYMTVRQSWLEHRGAEIAHDGIKTTCAAIWGKHVHEMIIAKAIETQADLVIKDMHAESAINRIFHSPLDWQLLRLCPVQLMLVNPKSQQTSKRIIAAVDPMEDSGHPHELNDRILQTALDVGMLCGDALHTVYVFEHLPPAAPGDIGAGLGLGYVDMLAKLEEIHRDAYNKLMDQYHIPPDRRHFLSKTFADTAISQFAHDVHTDLLIVGKVYRTGIDKLLMGSTAERILHRVECDVLAVKPKAFIDDVVSRYRGELSRGVDYGKLAA